MVRGRRGRVKNGTMSANGTSGRANRADDVRFEGNNGHDADVTRCPLMTHSGHCVSLRPAA